MGWHVWPLRTVTLSPLVRGWFGMQVEPWLYEPVNIVDLPTKHQNYLEQHTPDFERRGFARIGDFIMKRKPRISPARFFLNADGTILGNIEIYNGLKTTSCVSLCADGRYVETAAVGPIPVVPADVPMRLTVAPKFSVESVVETHARVLAEHCELAETEPLPMEADDFRDVLDYGHRLIARIMHREGLLPELPEFAREKEVQAV